MPSDTALSPHQADASLEQIRETSMRREGDGYTVPELARRYRVSEEKVRGWIRRGELAAVNTASTRCGKPRFVVPAEALQDFERGRNAAMPKPAKKRRRMKVAVDYFPD
ncbi:MAG TPA: helix-turn-helix domain-containing protein [Gemmataceae bacterium]|nr:helix-turn-helix domain-containing protein [Gemmataceae bacterium]